MSRTIRESDVDVDAIRARVSPQEAGDALGYVQEALASLRKLETLRAEGEWTHEAIRALHMVRDTLAEALDNEPD